MSVISKIEPSLVLANRNVIDIFQSSRKVCLMTVWSESRERAVEHVEEFSALRNRLLALRKRCGFTQSDLAEVMGVQKVTIARLEMMAGFRPRRKFLEKLASLEESNIRREEDDIINDGGGGY